MAPAAAPWGLLGTRNALPLPLPALFAPPVGRHPPFSGASRSGNDSRAHYVLRGSGNSRDRNARRRSLASGNCILLFPAALRVLINTRVWIYAHVSAYARAPCVRVREHERRAEARSAARCTRGTYARIRYIA